MAARATSPAVAAVRRAVRTALADGAGDVPEGGLVLVACSGGADSLALAAAAAAEAPRAARRAGAVVVDHGLQPGSAEVAAVAAAACRALGLDPVRVVAVTVEAAGDGPEAAARRARHAALERAAREEGASAVLLAHTADDQAETVLLGLARGSGARSLAGMAPRDGPRWRPLLGLPRATVRKAALVEGLPVHEDPHNADSRFARVRARSLLPRLEEALGPGAVAALARTADLLRADADVLDGLARELLERAADLARDQALAEELGAAACALGPVLEEAGGVVRLDVQELARAPEPVRRRALLAGAVRAGARPGALSHRHAVALDALVTRWRGQGPVHLPGPVEAARASGTLTLRGRR